MKKKYLLTSLIILLFSVILSVNPAHSQSLISSSTSEMNKLTTEAARAGSLSSVAVGSIVARGIQVVLGLLAIVFLGLTVMAGFQWMTAGGNEEQIKKATNTLKAAIIGLIIVLAAYTITYFIFNVLPFSSGGGTGTN